MRSHLCFIGVVGLVILALTSLAACANAQDSTVPPLAGNVNGTVLLRDAQPERPAAGLVVTALGPDAQIRAVSTRTAADGSFHFQVKPGWYLLTVDYWGEPATQVKVPLVGVAAATITAPTEERAATRAVVVKDPPAALPPRGVWLDGHLVLLMLPPARVPTAVMSREKATTGYENVDGSPARGVLAVVTAPGSFVGLKNPTKPLRDWLAWVVIGTRRRPTNVDLGGVPGKTEPPFLALHNVALLDARTGQFLLGFNTK